MVSSEISHVETSPTHSRTLSRESTRSLSHFKPSARFTKHSVAPNYKEFTDEELVARCQEELPHELQSYEELVRRYEPLVYGFCHRSIGSVDDAQEVCQDAFIRVFHKIHQFEGRSSFKTWLFRIAVNMCSTRKGTLAIRRTRTEVVKEELTTQFHSDSVTPCLDNLSDELKEAMDRLDEKNREIILMKYVSGLQLDEIASILKLKLSATKMRLYRARDELKVAYLKVTNTELAA